MYRYPRTEHLEGSALQAGDGKQRAPYARLRGQHLVVEEKLDGANAGIRFDAGDDGDVAMRLQSRGHDLLGGAREAHFQTFKSWAAAHQEALYLALGEDYVLYGEMMAAKHSQFYDRLPHLFCAFDLMERATGRFVSTPVRREMLADIPVGHVPVLHAGPAPARLQDLVDLIGPSTCRSEAWAAALADEAERAGVDPDKAWRETDTSGLMEGLYIKVESETETLDRYKYVRSGFLQTIFDSGSHWRERALIRNRLAPGIDIYDPNPAAIPDVASAPSLTGDAER